MTQVTTLVAALLFTPAALAVDAAVPADLDAKKALAGKNNPDAKHDGWKHKLKVGFTGQFTHASHVVGVQDGSTWQLGLLLEGSSHLLRGGHDWETKYNVIETFTKTPTIDPWIKSADEFDVQSTYMYRVKDLQWLGPFFRLNLNTQLLRGYDVRPETTNVRRTLNDGTVQVETDDLGDPDRVGPAKPANQTISLTSAFEPFLLRESFGVFANPVNTEKVSYNAKFGVAFQHIFTRDGFTLVSTDTSTTPTTLNLIQLRSSTQGGLDLSQEVNGKIRDGVTYTVFVNLFYPFYTSLSDADRPRNDNGDPLDGVELITYDVGGKLSVELASWISLDYIIAVKKIPLVVNEWQVQNNVQLAVAFDLI